VCMGNNIRKSADARVNIYWACGCSCNEFAGTSLFLDALFGELGEFLGSDDSAALGELALSEHLEVALNAREHYNFKREGGLTALVTSMTTALSLVEFLRASSETRVQSLSRFRQGLKYWFLL